jgi:SAM-dependent methyltransferase
MWASSAADSRFDINTVTPRQPGRDFMAGMTLEQEKDSADRALPGCRICGNSQGRTFLAMGFQWFDCVQCGAVQKVLTHRQYLDLNPSYDPGAFLEAASQEHIERFLRVDQARHVLERAVRGRLGAFPDGRQRSFLDVGCGMGQYLLAAQRLGFEVLGFEPSAEHAHLAKTRLKLPVISDYFSAERVGGRRFDLIMLSHVIEHIYSPKKFLHELIGVLKPGGVLIVITPNRKSIVAGFTGGLWPMLKPLDHVTMICAKTYSYFDLEGVADVRHSSSEFPFEFAATIAAVLKESVRTHAAESRCTSPPSGANKPPSLNRVGAKTKLLKGVLTLASAPAWLLAMMTGRQACLNTVIVRRAP